jgi:quercetin dioxygenase-like cupin family protein
MKKAFHFAILFSAALSTQALAQDSPIFTKGGVPLPSHKPGPATLVELNLADSIFTFNLAAATFPPGAKLDWHTHPGGQILLITEGIGYYQEKGKPKQVIHKGEVVKCLPGVEHWHGASPERGVTYIATNPTGKGGTIWGRVPKRLIRLL